MGFTFPSQLCSALRVAASFNASGPTCRFALRLAASFIVAGFAPSLARIIKRLAAASGVAPRSSRAVLFAGPAMAFVHRAYQIHLPLLPWDFVLSQVFAIGLRPPLLGPFPPGLFVAATDVSASIRSHHGGQRALGRCQGPTANWSAGASNRISSLSEVAAPAAKCPPTRIGAFALRDLLSGCTRPFSSSS